MGRSSGQGPPSLRTRSLSPTQRYLCPVTGWLGLKFTSFCPQASTFPRPPEQLYRNRVHIPYNLPLKCTIPWLLVPSKVCVQPHSQFLNLLIIPYRSLVPLVVPPQRSHAPGPWAPLGSILSLRIHLFETFRVNGIRHCVVLVLGCFHSAHIMFSRLSCVAVWIPTSFLFMAE